MSKKTNLAPWKLRAIEQGKLTKEDAETIKPVGYKNEAEDELRKEHKLETGVYGWGSLKLPSFRILLLSGFLTGFILVFTIGSIIKMAKAPLPRNNNYKSSIPKSSIEKETENLLLYERLNNERMKELEDSTDIPKNILSKWINYNLK